MTDQQLYDIIGEIVIETGFQKMVCIRLINPCHADDSVNVYGE
jgi:hypothetical protein